MKSRALNPTLYELSRPVPARFIKPPPQGKYGHYVPHVVIEQILLAIVGPYSFEHVETIYGIVPERSTNEGKIHPELTNAVVGVIMSLSCEIDGRIVTVQEAGSCDADGYESNNGERLKKATSDALKRCAMRLGVGLHLWCKTTDEYFLPAALRLEDAEPMADPDEEPMVGVEDR